MLKKSLLFLRKNLGKIKELFFFLLATLLNFDSAASKNGEKICSVLELILLLLS